VVAVVAGDVKRVAWRADIASLDAGSWEEVSVPVALKGKLRASFEFDATGPGRVFVANNRMESSVRSVAPAAGAVVFERCIAGALWTRPSMASIFTSLYPSVHGVETFDGVLSPSFDTLAEVFQRSRYRTAGVQSNATLEAERGFAHGFDEYRLFRLLTPTDIDPGVNPRADVVTATALDWLSQRGTSPFFLYVHYMDTHSPYCPPNEFADGAETPEDFYNGAVRFFSSEFAKLFDSLKSAGLLDTTTIVLTADHGEQFEEHGDTEHGNSVYIEEVHVPLLVWSPGGKTGARSPDLVSLSDVPVTLTELAGLDVPASMQGVSFSPALTGGRLPERDVYSELLTYKVAGHRYKGLTTAHWRYVHDMMGVADEAGRALSGQLFDSVNDSGERTSISSKNPKLAQELMAKAASFLASEAALSAKLLPNRVRTPLSQEEIEKLTAPGYISPSSETK
jgi:arylsulfatase